MKIVFSGDQVSGVIRIGKALRRLLGHKLIAIEYRSGLESRIRLRRPRRKRIGQAETKEQSRTG